MFSPDGYRALRDEAGLVRRGDRGVLAVTGADRLAWLQGLVTNDVLALPMGGVCDAAYLTPQGRMITDLRVVNLADRALLDVPGSLAGSLRTRLDALIFAEDVQIVDLSATVTIVDLHGPSAPAVCARAAEALAREAEAVVTDAAFGVPGFSVFVLIARADGVVNALTTAAAQETTLATLDVLRVEAGRPAFSIDMDEHTIPLEAGIEDRAVSFTKGCYVGQEVIVRVVHRGGGRVARKLVGLRLEQGELPKPGDVVSSGDREIGRVTSAVWSPTLQGGIALGYVHRDFVEPGTTLTVRTVTGRLGATVSALPLVEAQSAGSSG